MSSLVERIARPLPMSFTLLIDMVPLRKSGNSLRNPILGATMTATVTDQAASSSMAYWFSEMGFPLRWVESSMYVDSLRSASVCSFIVNGCSQGANVNWAPARVRRHGSTARRADPLAFRQLPCCWIQGSKDPVLSVSSVHHSKGFSKCTTAAAMLIHDILCAKLLLFDIYGALLPALPASFVSCRHRPGFCHLRSLHDLAAYDLAAVTRSSSASIVVSM